MCCGLLWEENPEENPSPAVTGGATTNRDGRRQTMTETQRLLTLEAALTACEGLVPAETVGPLGAWLALRLNVATEGYDFGKYLDAQRRAVRALARSPEVFGG